MAPLRIAVVSHLRHPIAPPFMGGMEAHSWHLVRGLMARGHDVTLVASGDSDAALPLRPIIAEHYDRRYPWHDFHGTDTLNAVLDASFARGCEILRDGGFDVIHNNALHRFPSRMARRDRIPMVTSLHVPPFEVLRRAVHDSAAPWSLFTVCSERQRGAWWPDGAPDTAHVVANGIDPDDWPFRPAGDGTAVWAGRITPNKGAHVAARAAQIAGLPLTLFGAIEHRDHFERDVRPHLYGDVRYGGHLSGRDFAERIGRASVMAFTPHWDEPFGLAAIEAMACGVPIAATDAGAIREVVGDCGVYAPTHDPEVLAVALRRACDIPRDRPRRRVMCLFGRDRMIDRYEDLYARAMGATRAPAPPVGYSEIELPAPGDRRISA